ncbi:MAG TPA: hypothetical protein V6D20_22680 [Candidatus Obscuribacterales bacterium]
MSLPPMSPGTSPPDTYADSVIGAAIFDPSGLPKEYFTTPESGDIGWVQTIFQALGLRSLLMSSLRLEGFSHAIIHGSGYFAIVVKQKANYIALLVRQNDLRGVSQSFVRWVHEFEPGTLRDHPRFNSV